MKALTACAGCSMAFYKPDINGIDCKVSREGVITDIGFQLRSTTRWRFDGDDLVYELDSDTYNQLVQYTPQVPSFLGLMIYPPPGSEWHRVVEGRAVLIRHGIYWEFLGGRQKSGNSRSITIRIPRRKVMTPDWLNRLFGALQSGNGVQEVLA